MNDNITISTFQLFRMFPAAELAALRADNSRLREALGDCAAVVDSFLNGQGAATNDEMDAALMSARAALGAQP